jgi:hypothetical protein
MLGGNFGGNISPSSSDSSDSEDDYLEGIRLTMPQSVESTPTGKHKGSSKTGTAVSLERLQCVAACQPVRLDHELQR